MLPAAYDEMVAFASQGPLGAELRLAKAEYLRRTGELFASDSAFERRLGSFLEWYVLDRPVSYLQPEAAPAQLYIAAQLQREVAAEALAPHRALCSSQLSLFEYRGARAEHMHLIDLYSGKKRQIWAPRQPPGLERGDIFEARCVYIAGKEVFTEAFDFAPRAARRVILRLMKQARRRRTVDCDADRIDRVHQVAYFSHRCARYRHVDPGVIFAQIDTWAPASGAVVAPTI